MHLKNLLSCSVPNKNTTPKESRTWINYLLKIELVADVYRPLVAKGVTPATRTLVAGSASGVVTCEWGGGGESCNHNKQPTLIT